MCARYVCQKFGVALLICLVPQSWKLGNKRSKKEKTIIIFAPNQKLKIKKKIETNIDTMNLNAHTHGEIEEGALYE